MKKYLLDTSLVAGYLLNRVRAIELVSPLIEREEAATTILVYGEVVEYVKGFVTIQKAHVEDVNRACPFSLEQGTVANTTAVARNEPFTLPF